MSLASIRANRIPTQLRGPWPNGRNVYGMMSPFLSGLNLPGENSKLLKKVKAKMAVREP